MLSLRNRKRSNDCAIPIRNSANHFYSMSCVKLLNAERLSRVISSSPPLLIFCHNGLGEVYQKKCIIPVRLLLLPTKWSPTF